MKLSKTSAHAALAMGYLAGQSGNGLVQARQVADHLGIPTDSALKILQALARQGLIQSQLGRTGGYQLHRLPSDVTLLEVVEAIEGPIQTQMPLHSVREQLTGSFDALQSVFEQVTRQIRSELGRATVASLGDCQSQEMLSRAG